MKLKRRIASIFAYASLRTSDKLKRLGDKLFCYRFFPDINLSNLSKNSKKALVIYDSFAIPYLIKGELSKFPYLNHHTMYWESCEIVRLLNKNGYIVDYLDYREKKNLDWNKYDLIIDSTNNLKKCKKKNQIKVYYSTHCHWLKNNLNELKRISQFKERNNLIVKSERQIEFEESDKYADYITYFGHDYLINSGFEIKAKFIKLNISSCAEVKNFEKNIKISKNNFLWIGGGGAIHKGLDLAVEAFEKINGSNLHIVGNFDSEKVFQKWLKEKARNNKNIRLCGRLAVNGKKFAKISSNCIGIVYPSCAEGGPGSVAQVLHFGLIPIVTRESNVRAENFGFIIDENNDKKIIQKIRFYIQNIMKMTDNDLKIRSLKIREFAKRNHTRKVYSKTFDKFLKSL